MAGSYPDVPGPRIAYDEDGTVVWQSNSLLDGTFGGDGLFTAFVLPPTELGSSDLTELNDEDSATVTSDGGPAAVDYGWAWIWPEKRDIFGFYGYATDNNNNYIHEIHTSTDSRNGVTGTFTTEADKTGTNEDGLTVPTLIQPSDNTTWSVQHSYREFIHPLSSTGTTSVRARVHTNKSAGGAVDQAKVCAFHWYGSIVDSANPDRLLFIDADTGLEFDEVQDWGDIPRGTVHDKEIWLKNNSASLAASSNVITFEGLYQDSYTWYSIQDNSDASPSFSSTLTVDGPISAGARYPSTDTLTVRLTVDPDENLGPAAARLQLVTGDWS